MKIQRIAQILTAHNVPFVVKGGRIYADTMEAFTQPFEHVEDLTNYTREDLFAWLGY